VYPVINDGKVLRFAKLRTIDLRTEYLRPGGGESFVCSGYILCTGNKIATTRKKLHDQRNTLIAVETDSNSVS
jgi:acyl-coenzyme A thioesterase PaaI-like protein